MKYPMHITVGFALQVARGDGPIKPAMLFGAQPVSHIVSELSKHPSDALMPCGHADCALSHEHASIATN